MRLKPYIQSKTHVSWNTCVDSILNIQIVSCDNKLAFLCKRFVVVMFFWWSEKNISKALVSIKCPCENNEKHSTIIQMSVFFKYIYIYKHRNIYLDGEHVLWSMELSKELPHLHYLIWNAWHIVHGVYLSWQGFPAVRARSGPRPSRLVLSLAITVARKGCFELLTEFT